MPTFTTEVTATVDVDFEVFCECGNGLCNQSDTRESRNRRYPQVVVEPCERCLEAAAEKARGEETDRLEARIRELENELAHIAA